MYYYAYLDENNIVVGVYSLPSQITADGYVEITEEQYNDPDMVGKVYDPTTGTFNDPIVWACTTADVQYKDTQKSLETKLDEIEASIPTASGTVDAYTKTESDEKYAPVEHTHTGYAASSHTHTAGDVIGVVKTINGTAPDENGNVAVSVSGGGMTAGEILDAVKTVDGANSGLDADTLDGMEASSFATANHTHTEYATNEDLAEKANATHSHAQSEIEGLTDALNGKADTSHTHTEYASTSDLTAVQNGLNAKADTDHTHTGYATANHTHDNYITTSTYANGMSGKADTNHTHSGYATSTHTHSGYASSSHTHSDYLSNSGGTVSGDVYVTGLVKVGGQQALYNSGSQMIVGTGNLATTIACASSSDVTVNGARMQIPSLLPRNGGTFQIGNTSYRFSGIYLTNSPNVSSDRRLKENIEGINVEEAVNLINDIDVVSFNYLGKQDDKQVGVIAQDIIEKAPKLAEAIVEKGEEGYYGVKTADLVFPLIVAVQELTKEVEKLKQKQN